jgi:hypothetical protein
MILSKTFIRYKYVRANMDMYSKFKSTSETKPTIFNLADKAVSNLPIADDPKESTRVQFALPLELPKDGEQAPLSSINMTESDVDLDRTSSNKQTIRQNARRIMGITGILMLVTIAAMCVNMSYLVSAMDRSEYSDLSGDIAYLRYYLTDIAT